MNEPQAILVINVSRIGDTLLSTPAIRAIAAAHPGVPVDVLGHPNRIEVVRHLPFVRHAGAIDKKWARLRGWGAMLAGPRYDLAFVYGFDLPLVVYALRVARRVVAFRQADGSINARLHRAVDVPGFKSEHAVDMALRLPAALDIPPAGRRLSYAVTAAETRWAEDRLAHDTDADAWPRIGVQVASFPTKGYRDWPIGHFIALCERLRARWPRTHFLIFGGGEEKARTLALKESLGKAATHYAGTLSLRQTGALMSKLDLYIGVDTGPTHMMGTFDIPMVALFHGYSPSELIGPLEHPSLRAIDHPLAGPDCSPDASMADISVDSVLAQAVALLGERR